MAGAGNINQRPARTPPTPKGAIIYDMFASDSPLITSKQQLKHKITTIDLHDVVLALHLNTHSKFSLVTQLQNKVCELEQQVVEFPNSPRTGAFSEGLFHTLKKLDDSLYATYFALQRYFLQENIARSGNSCAAIVTHLAAVSKSLKSAGKCQLPITPLTLSLPMSCSSYIHHLLSRISCV